MKTCPNCHFLVQDEAESCSVCKQVFVAPGGPDGPWLDHPDDPARDDPNWTPPVPTTGSGVLTAERLQAGTVEVRARPRPRPTRVLAWILLPILLVGLGAYGYYRYYGYLPLLPHFGNAVEVPDSAWTTYRDGQGQFSVEMPGEVAHETTVIEVGLAKPVPADTVWVDAPTFSAAMNRSEYPVGTGLSAENALDGMVGGSIAGGLIGGEVVRTNCVSTPAGPALDAEIRGSIDGVPAIELARVLVDGSIVTFFTTLAPVSSAGPALDIQNRMVTSFTVPAAPR